MNSNIRDLIKKLGEAIHESVIESDSINGVVQQIRSQGYDVMLMLEATIGLSKSSDSNASDDKESQPQHSEELVKVHAGQFSPHDMNFLKSLRISVDEEAAPGPAPASTQGD